MTSVNFPPTDWLPGTPPFIGCRKCSDVGLRELRELKANV